MKGFLPTSADETKIAIMCRRLTPAVHRRDISAIAHDMQQMIERYGVDLVGEAYRQLSCDHNWLIEIVMDCMDVEQRDEAYAIACEVMVEQIVDAGLRIEDHLRSSDEGIALTREAISALDATGYPATSDLGVGNQSLEGVGIRRSPFVHHLSEADPKNPNYVNFWAAASLFVSAALGWVPDEKPSPQAMEILKDAIYRISPNTDFETLISRARYDDRMLLKLASLVHESLTSPR